MTLALSDAVAEFCETAFETFHHPRFIAPDPLEVVREEENLRDREIVALVASSLALGRVEAIVATVRRVVSGLRSLGTPIADVLRKATRDDLMHVFGGFAYRFFNGEQLTGLLAGVGAVVRRHGSLEGAVSAALESELVPDDPLVRGMEGLVAEIIAAADGSLDDSILLARPGKGSACKRLFLFARWMVRRDSIDPGGWSVLASRDLLMPVDTHVIRVARHLGFTNRNQPSLGVSREITEALRLLDPEDPVRFDFSLTRPGIHPRFDEPAWLDGYHALRA